MEKGNSLENGILVSHKKKETLPLATTQTELQVIEPSK